MSGHSNNTANYWTDKVSVCQFSQIRVWHSIESTLLTSLVQLKLQLTLILALILISPHHTTHLPPPYPTQPTRKSSFEASIVSASSCRPSYYLLTGQYWYSLALSFYVYGNMLMFQYSEDAINLPATVKCITAEHNTSHCIHQCTVQHNTIQYNTVQYNTIQHRLITLDLSLVFLI